jgi:hypothetical protein
MSEPQTDRTTRRTPTRTHLAAGPRRVVRAVAATGVVLALACGAVAVGGDSRVDAVSSVVAASPGAGRLDVQYSAFTGASSYEIVIGGRTTAGTPLATTYIPNGSATSKSLNGFPGGNYVVRVRARDAAAKVISTSSDAKVSVAGLTNTSLATPAPPTLSAPATGQLTVAWTAVSGVSRYDLHYTGTTSTGSTVAYVVPSVWSTSRTIPLPAGKWTFRVRSVSSTASSSWSYQRSFTVLAAPGVPAVSSPVAGSLTATWAPVVGATGYMVQYTRAATAGSAAQTTTVPTATASLNVSGLAEGSYSVKVSATSTLAATSPTGPWSAPVSVNVLRAGSPTIIPLRPGTSWQWQIDGLTINETVLDGVANPNKMYDVDLFATPAATISRLKAKGIVVICYVMTGASESYRSDAGSFPASVLGKTVGGYPQERYLDIRQIDVLLPIMEARLDLAKSKGCDGIEPDLDDIFLESTGFPLTMTHQVSYNRAVAAAAHTRGMSIGLKNGATGGAFEAAMEPYTDWALNESCNKWNECAGYEIFIAKGKAVFQVEFIDEGQTTATFCAADNARNFDGLLKDSSSLLHALPRTACRFG